MRPVSQVGVRALPPAARVPWAHPCLARAMVISCSTLAVGSEPVVTGVRLARQVRCFAWGVQPWPPVTGDAAGRWTRCSFGGVQPRPQTVVPVGGGKDSRRQVAESRLRWVFCDDAVRHNGPYGPRYSGRRGESWWGEDRHAGTSGGTGVRPACRMLRHCGYRPDTSGAGPHSCDTTDRGSPCFSGPYRPDHGIPRIRYLPRRAERCESRKPEFRGGTVTTASVTQCCGSAREHACDAGILGAAGERSGCFWPHPWPTRFSIAHSDGGGARRRQSQQRHPCHRPEPGEADLSVPHPPAGIHGDDNHRQWQQLLDLPWERLDRGLHGLRRCGRPHPAHRPGGLKDGQQPDLVPSCRPGGLNLSAHSGWW